MADEEKFEGAGGAEQSAPTGDPSETTPDETAAPQAGEETAEAAPSEDSADAATELSAEDQAILDRATADLVAELREDALRAQAELVNFRARVERDRQLNREIVIAEVLRAMIPALDDLWRAEQHGDLPEGSPMALVAQKLRGAFERFDMKQLGVVGEAFDPNIHEAMMQIPSADVTVETVADVIEPGYQLGERVVRAAKVAVSVPKTE